MPRSHPRTVPARRRLIRLLVGLLALLAPFLLVGTASAATFTGQVHDVRCPTSSTCYAVGETSKHHAAVLTYVDHNLTRVTTAGYGDFLAIACPTSTVCEVAGVAGRTDSPSQHLMVAKVISGTVGTTRTSSAGWLPSGIDCVSAASCMVAGGAHSNATDGFLLPVRNGVPGTLQTTSGFLGGISCYSTTNCVAVGLDKSGRYGFVVPVHNGTKGAEQVMTTSSGLTGVSCPPHTTTTVNCVAVGLGADPSHTLATKITNGVAGRGYTNTASNEGLNGVSCSTAGSCNAVGFSFDRVHAVDVPVTKAHPGTAYEFSFVDRLDHVDCPDASDCAATGEGSVWFFAFA